MSTRYQRLLIIFFMVYFTLIGGTYYTERVASLRLFHQVLTALVFTGWLLTLWRRRRNFPSTPLDYPLVTLGLVWLLAAVFALDPRVSLEYTWPILTQILGFYLLIDLMRQGRQRWIMEGLFTVGAVIVILSAIEFFTWYLGLGIFPQFSQNWLAIGGLSLPPVIHKLALALNVSTMLGNFTATLLPLIAVWAMTARQHDLRIGLWMLAAGVTGVLIFTGSRGRINGAGEFKRHSAANLAAKAQRSQPVSRHFCAP